MNAALLRKELFPLLWETLLSVLIAVAGLAFAGEDVLPWGPPLAGVGDGLPLVALGLLLTGLALGMWQFEVERSAGSAVPVAAPLSLMALSASGTPPMERERSFAVPPR